MGDVPTRAGDHQDTEPGLHRGRARSASLDLQLQREHAQPREQIGMTDSRTSNERFVQIEPIDMVDFRAYVNAHGMYLEFFISGELVRFDMHGAKRWVEWAQRAIGASTEPKAMPTELFNRMLTWI